MHKIHTYNHLKKKKIRITNLLEMLLKGEPKGSTSASREWFSKRINTYQNYIYSIINLKVYLTSDFSNFYEMKTLFCFLEYFGANYSRTLLQ